MKFTSIFFTAATRNKRCIAFSEPWLCSFTIANKFALYSLAQALRRRNIYVPKGVRLAAPESIFDVFTLYIKKTVKKNIITKGTATNNPQRHEKINNHNSYEKLFLFF